MDGVAFIARLKALARIREDRDLCEKLGVDQHTLTEWRRTHEIPFNLVVTRFPGLDFNTLFSDVEDEPHAAYTIPWNWDTELGGFVDGTMFERFAQYAAMRILEVVSEPDELQSFELVHIQTSLMSMSHPEMLMLREFIKEMDATFFKAQMLYESRCEAGFPMAKYEGMIIDIALFRNWLDRKIADVPPVMM